MTVGRAKRQSRTIVLNVNDAQFVDTPVAAEGGWERAGELVVVDLSVVQTTETDTAADGSSLVSPS